MRILIQIFHNVKAPLLVLFLCMVLGSVGYKIILPDKNWGQILFMVAITFSTVGYSDFLGVYDNPIASIYTMLIVIVGMGSVLYAASSITAFIVEGTLKKIFITHKKYRRIGAMKNHFIICGAGNTGIHVIKEMHDTRVDFIVIDSDEELLEKIEEEFPNVPTISGDATMDDTLEKANIKNANGLVAVLSNDKDNLFLTISAKMHNPNIKIVSRAIDLVHMNHKLKKAGANYIVSPNFIGGMRIASEILRPHVVSFLDKMLKAKDDTMRIEGVQIEAGSSLIGKTLREAQIYDKSGLVVIATGLKENFEYNPPPDTYIKEDMVLLVITNPDQHRKLKEVISKTTHVPFQKRVP